MSQRMRIILYTEPHVFSMLLLGILLVRSLRKQDQRLELRYFQGMIASLWTALALDWAGTMAYIGHWQLLESAAPLLDAGYLLGLSGACFCWLAYTESIYGTPLRGNKRRMVCALLPLLLITVLLTVLLCMGFRLTDGPMATGSPLVLLGKTGSDGHQARVYLFCVGIASSYVIFSAVKGIWMATCKERYADRSRYLRAASFTLPVLLAGVLQMYVTEVPIFCLGATLTVVMAYINAVELQVSVDPLTGLNNRSCLLQYLARKMKNPQLPLYLAMIDVDDFKRINDQFGHVEGDYALTEIAHILKQFSAKHNCFCARYGGDEFALVYEGRDMDGYELCKALYQMVEEENRRNVGKRPYNLHLSAGCAPYHKGITLIPDFIAQADKLLYIAKKNHA